MGTIIEVVTPAESRDLTTLATVKDRLNILDNEFDVVLSQIITSASSHIETIANRTFARERIKEICPGEGGFNLVVSARPIVTIHEILYDNDPIVDFDVTKSDLASGIIWRETRWEWTPARWWTIESTPVAWMQDPRFLVEYTAGYTLPSFAVPTTPPILPADVEQYAVDLVSNWFRARTQEGTSRIKQIEVEGISITFQDNSTAQKDQTAAFLSAWKSFS